MLTLPLFAITVSSALGRASRPAACELVAAVSGCDFMRQTTSLRLWGRVKSPLGPGDEPSEGDSLSRVHLDDCRSGGHREIGEHGRGRGRCPLMPAALPRRATHPEPRSAGCRLLSRVQHLSGAPFQPFSGSASWSVRAWDGLPARPAFGQACVLCPVWNIGHPISVRHCLSSGVS